MKKILIVDDTNVVRSFLSNKLKPYADQFEVLTAKNGEDALRHIKSFPVDLVMTDLEMPVMDGFELLVYMNANHPEIPMFVMTANGSPEVEERINSLGSIKYFEKPMDIEHLVECITEELDSGAKGQIQGIGLASFLQLVEVESKTCTLIVSAKKRKGSLGCLKGELINAIVDDLTGLEAAYELVSWDNASIEITNTVSNKNKEISHPLMSVIMEGLKRKDERDAQQQ